MIKKEIAKIDALAYRSISTMSLIY